MWGEREREDSWYDTMLVCLNGHQITRTLKSHPEDNQPFCNSCGTQTIHACPKCRMDIPGYKHIPGVVYAGDKTVPKRCTGCGTAFPWAVPPEHGHFCEFVERSGEYIRNDCTFSVWALSLTLYTSRGLDHLPHPSEKCAILSNYYWSLRKTLEAAVDINAERLNHYVGSFNALLRSLESCLKDMLGMLAYEGDLQPSAADEYGKLLSRFNQFADQYEQFLKRTGRTELTFLRLPSLADVPKRINTPEGERIFAPGSSYDVYKHVRALVTSATKEVFVVEPHPNEELFELYLDKVPNGVPIRVLVQQPHGSFGAVAKKFCAKTGIQAEIRQSASVHDRVIFVDGRCWVLGQSVKDAAKAKPTYIVELEGATAMKQIHEGLWSAAKPAI